MKVDVEKVLKHLYNNAENTSRPKGKDVQTFRHPKDGPFKYNDIVAIAMKWSDQYKNWFVDVMYRNQETNSIVGFKLTFSTSEKQKWWERIDAYSTRNDFGDDDLDDFEEAEPTVEVIGSNVSVKVDAEIIPETKTEVPEFLGSENEIAVCECGSRNCEKDISAPFGDNYICECGNCFQWKSSNT